MASQTQSRIVAESGEGYKRIGSMAKTLVNLLADIAYGGDSITVQETAACAAIVDRAIEEAGLGPKRK